MDLDVFVTAHRTEWDRLDHLLHRGRQLTGAEADELVALYQRTATHLSLIQSSAPDPLITARLTQLVARARSTVTGTRRASWRDAARFLTAGFPAAVYRSRHWWIPTAVLSIALAAVIGWWIGWSVYEVLIRLNTKPYVKDGPWWGRRYRVAGVMDMVCYVAFKNLLVGATLFLVLKALGWLVL